MSNLTVIAAENAVQLTVAVFEILKPSVAVAPSVRAAIVHEAQEMAALEEAGNSPFEDGEEWEALCLSTARRIVPAHLQV